MTGAFPKDRSYGGRVHCAHSSERAISKTFPCEIRWLEQVTVERLENSQWIIHGGEANLSAVGPPG